MSRRGGIAWVAAAAAALGVALCPAPDALAAPAPATCVTSQLQPVPGIGQKLGGNIPVVFIHGINSSAAMWAGTSGASIAGQAALIKGVTAWTFDYANESLDWVKDNRIGPAFAARIACLEQASGHKVLVVAHSMGGLATQYAIGYPGSPAVGDVAELITIGTPYQGSPLLSALQAVVSGSETGSLLGADAGYVVFAEALLSACAGIATHTNVNPCSLIAVMRSPVGTALEENSPDIRGLPPWPDNLPVLDAAGDISKIRVFTGSPTFSQDIGDGVVSLASATAHDTTGQSVVEQCISETIARLVHNPGGCFHTHLPNDPAIINAILAAIRAYVKEKVPAQISPSSFPIEYPEDMTLACNQQYGEGTQAQWVDTITPASYGMQCFRAGSLLGGIDLNEWCPAEAARHQFRSAAGWYSGNPYRYSTVTSTIKPWKTWRCYQK